MPFILVKKVTRGVRRFVESSITYTTASTGYQNTYKKNFSQIIRYKMAYQKKRKMETDSVTVKVEKKPSLSKETKALVTKAVKATIARSAEVKIPNYYRFTSLTDNTIKCYNLLAFIGQGVTGVQYIGEQFTIKEINIHYILKQISAGTSYLNTRHFRMMVIETEQQLTSTETNVAADLVMKNDTGDVVSGVFAPLSFPDKHKVRVVYERYIAVNRNYNTEVKDYRGVINVKPNKKFTYDDAGYFGRNNYYLLCAFYDGSVTNTQVALQADWQVQIQDM